MKITYITLILGIVLMFGCEKEKPEMFTVERFIKFKFGADAEDEYYKLNYSFAFENDTVKSKKISFPVEFRGYDLVETLYFAVAADDKNTTLPGDCYLLEKEQAFHADSNNIDSLHVVLYRKPILKDESKILRLCLKSNEHFTTYMPDSLFVEIVVGDILMKPEWWDEAVEKSYLGTYSKTKYEAFMEETGIYDFGALEPSEKRHYAIVFKRALEKNPRIDEDNSVMAVTITG